MSEVDPAAPPEYLEGAWVIVSCRPWALAPEERNEVVGLCVSSDLVVVGVHPIDLIGRELQPCTAITIPWGEILRIAGFTTRELLLAALDRR